MSDLDPLSQSRLGDYARCQQYYEFERDWDVETPDETVRYLRRGTALHGTIEDTWRHVHPNVDEDGNAASAGVVEPMGELPMSDRVLREYAREAFDRRWADHVPRDAYQTRSHFDYDRRASRAAIDAYFGDGPGLDHLRRAIASEVMIPFDHEGLSLHGKLDLVTRTDGGLHVIDFKTTLNGVISTHSYWGPKAIEDHGTDAYNHRYIKSLMQAAIYRRAARELDACEDGASVDFSFYGLRDDVERLPSEEGVVPDVTGELQTMTDFLDDHYEEAWGLIREHADGIRSGAFEPDPWELIYENVCDGCKFREMCPEYLSEEVIRIE